MSELEERFLENFDLKSQMWCCCIDDKFFTWQYEGETLNEFTENLNKLHSTIRFPKEYLEKSIHF